MTRLTDQELIEIFTVQLPGLLERRPELEYTLYNTLLKHVARRDEVVAILAEWVAGDQEPGQILKRLEARMGKLESEVHDLRVETNARFEQVDRRFEQVDKRFEQVDKRFEQVDKRFEQVDQRFAQQDARFESLQKQMDEGFKNLQKQIDRLGARWGIRNESLFRETVEALLQGSFGVRVEQKHIAGEQFDVVIFDGQHILVEITASADAKIQERLERKRKLYTDATGIAPTRVILATASIHSKRAQALRDAGFEVIEPEETDESQ